MWTCMHGMSVWQADVRQTSAPDLGTDTTYVTIRIETDWKDICHIRVQDMEFKRQSIPNPKHKSGKTKTRYFKQASSQRCSLYGTVVGDIDPCTSILRTQASQQRCYLYETVASDIGPCTCIWRTQVSCKQVFFLRNGKGGIDPLHIYLAYEPNAPTSAHVCSLIIGSSRQRLMRVPHSIQSFHTR